MGLESVRTVGRSALWSDRWEYVVVGEPVGSALWRVGVRCGWKGVTLTTTTIHDNNTKRHATEGDTGIRRGDRFLHKPTITRRATLSTPKGWP